MSGKRRGNDQQVSIGNIKIDGAEVGILKVLTYDISNQLEVLNSLTVRIVLMT